MLNLTPFGENGGANGGMPSQGPGWQGAPSRPKLGGRHSVVRWGRSPK